MMLLGLYLISPIGVIGDYSYHPDRDSKPSLSVMVDFLQKYYGRDHEVYVYQASEYAICKPIIQRLPLSKVATDEAIVNYASTLYVPPKTSSIRKADYNIARKLGVYEQLKPTDIHSSIKRLFHLK
jgi:hypothetical protein